MRAVRQQEEVARSTTVLNDTEWGKTQYLPNAYYEAITEKQFHQRIVEIARLYKWMLYHTFDSRKSEAGYPDDTLVHPDGDFFMIEEKTEKGRLTPAQKQWIAALERSGIEIHVYRPHQIDEIIARLQK